MRPYTRKGDRGETSDWGRRTHFKSAAPIYAQGDLDEAIAVLGLVRSALSQAGWEAAGDQVIRVQSTLYLIAATISAGPTYREKLGEDHVSEGDVQWLEHRIDEYVRNVGTPKNFVVPGDSRLGAEVHLARAVLRRAERSVVAVTNEVEGLPGVLLNYLNRSSDLFFMLAIAVDAQGDRGWTLSKEERRLRGFR